MTIYVRYNEVLLYRGPFSYILPELGQRKLFVISDCNRVFCKLVSLAGFQSSFCDFLNKSDVFVVQIGYLSIYSTSPNTFKHLKRKEGKF